MRNVFLISTVLAATLAAPAFADDDEIVVTATRAPTQADTLPARVEVIERADIEDTAQVTVAEALGPSAVQSGGVGQQTSLFIRGSNSKHALALFDGIRLNDASNPTAQYDFGQDTLGALERVEVLRGPASAIYGSDALGGVVNLIPRRGGEAAFEPFLEVAAGSFATTRGLIGATGASGGWEYGVSAEHFRTDGYDLIPDRMVTDTGDDDPARLTTFTGTARYDTGVFAFDVLARARDTRVAYDTFSGGPFFDLRADDPDLETESSQQVWRVGGELEPSDTLTLRLSGGQVTSDRTDLDGGFTTSAADSERTFADFIVRYQGDGLSLTGGLAFERNQIDTQPQFASPLSAEEDQSAAYAIVQIDVGANAVLTGSARVDDYENFGTQTTYSIGGVVNLGALRAFASYGTAFKAPSLSERFETSFFNIGNPDLDPEDSQSWEVGADWRANDALRFGASYYQTRIENLIEYDFFQLMNVNVGEAEIDGVEAYAEVSAGDWAVLRASYAWTDATNGATGAQLARRPEDTWRLDARLRPTDRLTLAATWTYVGERTDVTYSDAGTFLTSNGVIDAFNVASLAATFDLDDRAQIFVRVDNVTDEAYEQPAAFAGAPRSVTFGVRAAF